MLLKEDKNHTLYNVLSTIYNINIKICKEVGNYDSEEKK